MHALRLSNVFPHLKNKIKTHAWESMNLQNRSGFMLACTYLIDVSCTELLSNATLMLLSAFSISSCLFRPSWSHHGALKLDACPLQCLYVKVTSLEILLVYVLVQLTPVFGAEAEVAANLAPFLRKTHFWRFKLAILMCWSSSFVAYTCKVAEKVGKPIPKVLELWSL